MLAGGIIGRIGVSLAIAAYVQLFNDPSDRNFILPRLGTAVFTVGLLSYLMGLIGLCARWDRLARRANELEELRHSLLQDRSDARSG